MQLDESTISDSNDLLMEYVRYLNENNALQEETLFILNLTIDTTGLSIFTTVRSNFAKHHILFSKIIACDTDGGSLMIGHNRWSIAFFLRKNCQIFCVYFVR
jgi:hypothetical protein